MRWYFKHSYGKRIENQVMDMMALTVRNAQVTLAYQHTGSYKKAHLLPF